VRIFHTVEHHDERSIVRQSRGVFRRRPVGDDALMGLAVRRPVESGPLLEAHRNTGTPAEIDDLLQPLAARAFGQEHAIQRPPSGKRLPDRVDTNQKTHVLDVS
jgi:hypothetical protein